MYVPITKILFDYNGVVTEIKKDKNKNIFHCKIQDICKIFADMIKEDPKTFL